MDCIIEEDLIIDILQHTFQKAENIKIVENWRIEGLPNNTSEIVHLKIEYQECEILRSKHLILKIPNTGNAYQRCSKLNIYSKERRMYDAMIPRMKSILRRELLPTHYFTTDTEIFVLEDFAAQGYRSFKSNQFFSLEDSYLVLRALAEFHAASYELSTQNPHLLDEPAFDRTSAIDLRRDFIDPWESVICELFERKNAAYRIPKFRAAMSSLRRTEDEAVYSRVKRSLFKLTVLNHGDVRQENLMLKYDDSGRVQDVKMIDFQTCWWSTPAYDFLCFLLFSVEIDVIEKHFDTLVEEYWQYFCNSLMRLGVSCDYRKTDFSMDIQKINFMLAMWLLARCTFTCPFNRIKMNKLSLFENEKSILAFYECLDDRNFVHYLWGWLEFCEKLRVFDSLEHFNPT